MTKTKIVSELRTFARSLSPQTRLSASEIVEAYQRYKTAPKSRSIETRDVQITPRVLRLIVKAFRRSAGRRVVLYFRNTEPDVKVMSFERMTLLLQQINNAKRGLAKYYREGKHLKARGK